MLKPATAATVLGAFLFVVSAVPAAADAGPNPPPGGVSLQPTSLSAGSQSQPASNTSVSTGRAGASSDGQSAFHCGLKASTAGSGQSAEPARVSTGGTSTPTDCNAATTSNGAASTTTGRTYGQNAKSTINSGQSQGAGTVIGSSLLPKASEVGSVATLLVIGLLGLALLLALFLLLLGFAVGRRRQARAAT